MSDGKRPMTFMEVLENHRELQRARDGASSVMRDILSGKNLGRYVLVPADLVPGDALVSAFAEYGFSSVHEKPTGSFPRVVIDLDSNKHWGWTSWKTEDKREVASRDGD